MRTCFATFVLLLLTGLSPLSAQPLTGLDGWSLFIDPGHSGTENMGVFGYSEAEKNLAVALALEELLVTQTDIEAVYLSRDEEDDEISLGQRVDFANDVAADHFHSVHSNAAAPSTNFVLLLWPQWPDGSEAEPNGGKRMSELMVDLLEDGMRLPSRGAIGECDFYVTPCSMIGSGKGGSRNFVQKYTTMASELSEAGFHTNPRQNQLNMNADWKRMEARLFFWAILDYHGVDRPPVRTATGTVRDAESGEPINGATVHIADTAYTTDTYASLFHEYSNDPDALHNGFYYLDALPAGTHQVVTEAEGYITHQDEVTLDEDFLTFHDVNLISTVPPVVTESVPGVDGARFNVLDPIEIVFSRPMEPATVENSFSLTPSAAGTFAWSDGGRRVVFQPDSLLPFTDYTLTIGADAASPYGYRLDGDGDGSGGDAFSLAFSTGAPDGIPPSLTGGAPVPYTLDVSRHPVLTYEFDEELDTTSLTPERFALHHNVTNAAVTGTLEHYTRNERTAITFFPDQELDPNVYYTFSVATGIRDMAGNATERSYEIIFRTTSADLAVQPLATFEGDLELRWWAPQQSGSTTGIVTTSTGRTAVDSLVNHLSGSTQAMRLDYGWDTGTSSHLIRVVDGETQSGSPQSFSDEWLLQAYVLGDGSGNLLRFAVDDAGSTEVSPWYPVDWIGWQLVSWDLAAGETGSWIGDGTLNGRLEFDSFQLSHAAGQPATGSFVIDDLRLVRASTGSDADDEPTLPARLTLHANYPNPFSSSTTLSFALPEPAEVTIDVYDALGRRVATLAREQAFTPGEHAVEWDAADLPSGVYVARLQAGSTVETVRMVRVR